MSTFGLLAPVVPALAKHGPTEVRGMFRQIFDAAKELPGIRRGVWKIARPFSKELRRVACFNACIAMWSIFQAYVLGLSVELLGSDASYLDKAVAIVWPFLIITLPSAIVLPYFRDFYTMWCLRPQFDKHASIACLMHQQSLGSTAGNSANGPAAQEGQYAAYMIMEFCVKEPFNIAKGILSTVILLYYTNQMLLWIVMVGVCVDVYIMVNMRDRLVGPVSRMQDCEFRIKGFQNIMLGGKQEGQKISVAAFSAEYDKYIHATRKAERLRMKYQLTRALVMNSFRITTMALVAWWAHTGQISAKEYFALIALAAVANDPFEIILNFMWKLVTLREQLRRFGSLCGIDFGLAPAKETI